MNFSFNSDFEWITKNIRAFNSKCKEFTKTVFHHLFLALMDNFMSW